MDLKQLINTLLITLLANEIIGNISRISHWLIRLSAQRLPTEDREDFIEDNVAVNDAIDGPLSKLYDALGCFWAAASLANEHAVASNNPASANTPRKWGIRLLAVPLLAPVIWNIYTTFRGLADFFDLSTHPSINPGQFAFGIIVTIIVIGFVIASRPIWKLVSGDVPFLLLKAASVVCIAINVSAAWVGMKDVISFEDAGPGKSFGLAFVVAFIVVSIIGLSALLFDKDDNDKAMLL